MSFPNSIPHDMYAEHQNPAVLRTIQHNFLHLQEPSSGPHHQQSSWGPPPEEEHVEHVEEGTWQNARYKAEILGHPLYEQLLAAHVACLRIATPVDQLPRIDAQLAQAQAVVGKYSVLGGGGGGGGENQLLVTDEKELDQFMVGESKFF